MGKGYRILSIEAKDLYDAMNFIDGSERDYCIRNNQGELKYNKFINTLDWSLHTIKLEEVYTKITRKKYFGFEYKNNRYTQNIINVTFNYSYKEYNKVGNNIFIKSGYNYRKCLMNDGICIESNELIAIDTSKKIDNPVDENLLAPYFTFNDGYYKQKKEFRTIMNKFQLRDYLYRNGFRCDGINYVVYKRSCGSARLGKVIFINDILYSRMDKWDKCGLRIKDGEKIDLASWEAYISLPMSSIIDTMDIKPENFLVVDDYNSVFDDEVIAISSQNDGLVAETKTKEISNSIWDGQSLMDKSMFGKYASKGMLLLRNQFFKTCAFNTNIQEWFKENNITSVNQLNGFTLAKDIADVKIITTPSSIKYCKFGKIEEWFKNISTTFGIVKYEKETHFFNGRMVQSHYQLFNTLQLSQNEINEILKPSINYMELIMNDPDVLRFAIKYLFVDDNTAMIINTKNELIYKMLGVNNNFANTKIYNDFLNDFIKSFKKNLKRGHILLNGNYSTILGNGLELLKYSINKFDGTSAINENEIYNKNFDFGKEILCSRSPHVTMGNIYLAKNTYNSSIDRFFNLTNEIVYVNAINNNIQQRLNGADYDSDTMLLTDDKILVDSAKKNYKNFKVPTNFVEMNKIERYYTCEQKVDLDVKTSVNKIGEIINLSQYLNSLYWDRLNSGIEDNKDLYNDICKLAVLSNIEIDKAKREYAVNTTKELIKLKNKYKIIEEDKIIKPYFFKMITKENGYEISDSIKYKYFKTSMDYLQNTLNKRNKKNKRKEEFLPFTKLLKPQNFSTNNFYKSKKDEIINLVKEYRKEINMLYSKYETLTKEERKILMVTVRDKKEELINNVVKLLQHSYTMYLTLKELDNKDNLKIARIILEILFETGNETLFQLIKDNKENIPRLEESSDGNVMIYNFIYKKVENYI